MPKPRTAALLLAAASAAIFAIAAWRFGDPFASVGAFWFDAQRESLQLFQRAVLKFAPGLWTYVAAPLLRVPLGLIILIPAAELLSRSRTP